MLYKITHTDGNTPVFLVSVQKSNAYAVTGLLYVKLRNLCHCIGDLALFVFSPSFKFVNDKLFQKIPQFICTDDVHWHLRISLVETGYEWQKDKKEI